MRCTGISRSRHLDAAITLRSGCAVSRTQKPVLSFAADTASVASEATSWGHYSAGGAYLRDVRRHRLLTQSTPSLRSSSAL